MTLSPVRLVREGLSLALGRHVPIEVVGLVDFTDEAVGSVVALRPDVALLDMSVPHAIALGRRMHDAVPRMRLIAYAVADVECDVVACARAGISGFVARDASVADLAAAVLGAMRDELLCTPRVAALLLRGLASVAASSPVPADTRYGDLTERERDIARLMELGLANKEIAFRLDIGVATVKNHVHHVLQKLHVNRRGEAAAHLRGTWRATDAPSAGRTIDG